ncbi:porphobilinogen deaminase [Gammaproteobacteria bacterium SCGC AG-212-F23]|nr:porphobilinogen deaminase [Gammaproteobacteria bacterium SCGC AG-212-F23]
MIKTYLTIATRESPLALWQANWVKLQLEKIHPDLKIELLGMTTSADRMLDVSLDKVGGKGLFVKELEDALLQGRADIAVHSMKDVPVVFPPGLHVPVMCVREEPRDVLVSTTGTSLKTLPANAIIGTSSLRRQSQLAAIRPDLQFMALRGNVNTRLKKLDEGMFTAIVLAAAGLKRLGLEKRITSFLTFEESLPAAGQGVLGIECRLQDDAIQKIIAPLNHPVSFACVTAERAMCKQLNGNCQTPIAAYAEIQNNQLYLRGLVASPDGKIILRAEATHAIDQSEELGYLVAETLKKQGALTILAKD